MHISWADSHRYLMLPSYRCEAILLNVGCHHSCMKEDIEQIVESLKGQPVSEEITQNHTQYTLWFLSNFRENLPDNSYKENAICQRHLENISMLSGYTSDQTLHFIREHYISFLEAKAARFENIDQPPALDRYVCYSEASRCYLEDLTELVGDHFGRIPDQIHGLDAAYIGKIHSHLKQAHAYAQGFNTKNSYE